MAYVVVMPRLGQTMEVGEIVEWMKGEGDSIEKGEVLLSIQSDKAELEVEADYSGVLVKILATPENGEIPCFEPIGIMAAPDETVDVEQVLAEFRAKQGA
jgi:pyruvate/2-oxoglutarate dehydrogenase complex dihydrolipoamide acyltransferase (E2) component